MIEWHHYDISNIWKVEIGPEILTAYIHRYGLYHWALSCDILGIKNFVLDEEIEKSKKQALNLILLRAQANIKILEKVVVELLQK